MIALAIHRSLQASAGGRGRGRLGGHTAEEGGSHVLAAVLGPLRIVEDRSVESAMVEFGKCLPEGCQRSELKSRALDLAHKCRHEISDIWDLKLQELKGESDQ